MDGYFIALLLAILLVVILIFKFMKKIVHAIIVVVLFFIVVIGAIGLLVYSDYNYYTKQDSYDIKLVYVSKDSYLFGVSAAMTRGGGFDATKGLSSLTSEQLSSLKTERTTLDNGQILVEVDETVVRALLAQDRDYKVTLSGQEIVLTSDDVLLLLDSANEKEVLLEILPKKLGEDSKISTQQIDFLLSANKVQIKETLLLLVLSESAKTEDGVVVLVDSFKAGDIKIYPERLSVKLLKSVLPTKFITEKISAVRN